MKKTTVLIADGHAIVRSGLRALLCSRRELEVIEEAQFGEDAIKKAAKHQPDLLILDISMPDLNGIEVARRVRSLSPATRIIVLSMYMERAYIRSIFAAGGFGYVLKQSSNRELMAAIAAVQRGRRYIDPELSDAVASELVGMASPAEAILTKREKQVLRLVALGYTNLEIGSQLGISFKTVDTYRTRIGRKLGLNNRAAITRYALQTGTISTLDSLDGNDVRCAAKIPN